MLLTNVSVLTGTFDEMWDCVCCKKLNMNGLDHKPVCLLNYNGYFDGSIEQLKRAHDDHMLYGEPESYFHTVTTIQEAMSYCISEVKRLKQNNKSSITPTTTYKERKMKNDTNCDNLNETVVNTTITTDPWNNKNTNDIDVYNKPVYSILWLSIGFTVGIATMSIVQRYNRV